MNEILLIKVSHQGEKTSQHTERQGGYIVRSNPNNILTTLILGLIKSQRRLPR